MGPSQPNTLVGAEQVENIYPSLNPLLPFHPPALPLTYKIGAGRLGAMFIRFAKINSNRPTPTQQI